MEKGFVIAIDGPVAAGKGTIAPRLADLLHGFYLYTGGTYRSVALFAIEQNVDLHDTEKIIALLPTIHIQFIDRKIILNGRDVTERIKESDAANGASIVGVIPKVRVVMVKVQHDAAMEAIDQGQIVIIEGRDTATKVFPDAALRVFLTASDEVRAKRRLAQYLQQGEQTDFEKVLEQIRERDKRDKERETDPLPTYPEQLGYFVLDNSEMDEQTTLDTIKEELVKRNLL